MLTSRQPKRQCELCSDWEECRPYGPDGKWICFSCGMKDPTGTTLRFIEIMEGPKI